LCFLSEDGPDGGGDHLMLALGHVGKRVAHEVNAAALPSRAKDLGDGRFQSLVRIRNDKLDAFKPRFSRLRRKPSQKVAASEAPIPRPRISRRPSALTPVAIIAATDTMRPSSRTFR